MLLHNNFRTAVLPDTASCFWFLILPTTSSHSFLSRIPPPVGPAALAPQSPGLALGYFVVHLLHHKLTSSKLKRVTVLLTAVPFIIVSTCPPTSSDPVTVRGSPVL